MKKNWILFLFTGVLLAGCISISSANTTPTSPPQFVTSTLPPTKSLALLPTNTPLTPSTGSETPTFAITAPANCKVQAVLLEDVTIPDDTLVPAGKSFTKTWRFKNSGTCHWTGFTINFLTGDRMGASTPSPDTPAGSTGDISLELTAPTENGAYSGYFTLKDADGESINVGTEKTFWLQIIVADGDEMATSTPIENSSSQLENATSGSGVCDFDENSGYINQIKTLINDERQSNGLSKLSINSQLATAAQKHAADMACSSILSHTGSDDSYVNARIAATGYSASYSEEIIYAGGGPKVAFDWWMDDKPHRDAILSTKSTEMGIGYAYLPSSTYGGYFTVDFAKP